MSSFELLELFGVSIVDDPKSKTRTIRIEFAPEDGVLAEGLRGGERSEWKQMLAQTANETAVLRAGQVQGADADEYGSRLFFPVWRERQFVADDDRAHIEQQKADDDPDGGLSAMWHQQEVS